MSLIDTLIEEIVVDCGVCQGGYIYSSEDVKTDPDEPIECPDCDGTGKAISYEGEILRHIILEGEMP